MKTTLINAAFVECEPVDLPPECAQLGQVLVPVSLRETRAHPSTPTAQEHPRIHRQSRVLPDAYHSLEEYRGFVLRYCWDPAWQDTVRVYVEHHPVPDWGGRDDNPQITHLDPTAGGAPPHICFKKELAPRTLEQAAVLAHRWADLTLRYIDSGRCISEQIQDAG